MEPHLSEVEIHSHLTPLHRIGAMRTCILDGEHVLHDRMNLGEEPTQAMAQALNALFETNPLPKNEVSQVTLGFDAGQLFVCAYHRLRLAVFLPLTLDLSVAARAACRVVQEMAESYKRAGYRSLVRGSTVGEMHRSRGYGQDAPVALFEVVEEPPRPVPAPFPPRPGSENPDEDLALTPIRPTQHRTGAEIEQPD